MKKSLLALSLVAMSTFAATPKYEIGLGIGKHNVSSSPIEDYNFINVRIGKYLPKNHILRFELEKSEKFFNNTESLARFLVNVEHYFTLEDTKIVPYAFVGLGHQSVSGNYDDNFVADLGIGAKYGINDKFGAFLEIRGLRDFGNNDNHYGAILGLTCYFGDKKVEKTIDQPKEEKVVVYNIDDDKDGVLDNVDKCLNTPSNVKVDVNGCAIDSDNDGVADYLDKCINTPSNVKVDADGCAVDSDNDGVADYLDKCPNTKEGFKVAKDGCPVTFNFNITFKNNNNEIQPEFMVVIEEFATFLKENPSYKAEIQGYTDSKGSATYNKQLSTKRAKAVYEALLNLGVDKNQISYAGYGEENPIASNDTEEGKAKNRRVVAKLYH